jgi:hypothetical protein
MSKDAEKAASKVFFDGQVRIGAIAGHVGKNQWQLEFHPPKKKPSSMNAGSSLAKSPRSMIAS